MTFPKLLSGVCPCLACALLHRGVLSIHGVYFCWCVCCLPLITAAGSQTERLEIFPQHLQALCAAQAPPATTIERTHVTWNNMADMTAVWSGKANYLIDSTVQRFRAYLCLMLFVKGTVHTKITKTECSAICRSRYNSFGVSCLVLEILALEMYVFSRI